MNLPRKYLIILIILGFVIFQLYLIFNEFSSTRIIEVRKEIYENNEKSYLKGYDIVNVPYEQFDIKVSPKSFFDYLLLTNEKGNLLSIILRGAAACCLAWFIFQLDLDLDNRKRFRWLKLALFLTAISFFAIIEGLDHTKDFWESAYSNKPKIDSWQYAFYIDKKSNSYSYLYFWILIILNNFLDTTIDYYQPTTIPIEKNS